MQLNDLLAAYQGKDVSLQHLAGPQASASQQVVRVVANSRQASPGVVFVALHGTQTDGHQFVSQAIKANASAILVQKQRWQTTNASDISVPVYGVDDSYLAFALLNSLLYGEPGEHLQLIGVTGTNGKTTVTHLIEKMISRTGISTGLIGTLGSRTAKAGDVYADTGHTTPMADGLQSKLADMRREGVQAVVMEVSSHALVQHRVAGCRYQLAVMTNLTQDHLDYHRTMEDYFEAKALLFRGLKSTPESPAYAVLNQDDAYGARYTDTVDETVAIWTYGFAELVDKNDLLKSGKAKHCVLAQNVEYSITGATYTALTPVGELTVRLKMAGAFSVYNSLAALASGLALGLNPAVCVEALENTEGVRGRFEVVSQKPYVIVDYAHTPDGLENVLKAARAVLPAGAKLYTVFGCGGDRDATKRPKMGKIVDRLADRLVITSDNPRSEDPQQIISDILAGIHQFDSDRIQVHVDRRTGIRSAIDWAGPDDVIVVAGKGHEDYQILADRVIHFDDKEEVQTYIQERSLTTPTVSSS